MRPNEPDEDYPAPEPTASPQTSGVGVGFGAASLVIGLLAVFFSLGLSACCFLLGWLTVPFSAIGLILGVVGLVVPLVTKTRGIILPISGIAVNSLALGIVLLGQVFGFSGIGRPPTPGPGRPPIVNNGTDKTPPIEPVTQGDVKVTVLKVEREAERLVIRVQVQNVSGVRKVTFRTWGDPEDADAASLADESRNDYKLLGPGKKAERILNPNGTHEDVLYFELPLEDFDSLILELPTGHFTTAAGRIRYVIPKEKVVKGS